MAAPGAILEHEPRHVLIVEDNVFIAMEMEQRVAECGCLPVGPAGSVAEGLDAVRRTRLDAAVLDINLGEERVWPVADLLHAQSVPFLLATGYSIAEIPHRFGDRIVLHKPVRPGVLERALVDLGVVSD